ncbi:MAG: hypothetical protein FWC47_03350 [Oscillospiraceae bacterium]|nr:hypothetical protein [Oscillospiraceae bacterium]
MPLTFKIKSGKIIKNKDILELLDNNVRIANLRDKSQKDLFGEGYEYIYYLPDLSTKGVLISYDLGIYEVEVNALSCEEDYELAFKMVSALNSILMQPIFMDRNKKPLNIEELKSIYTKVFIFSKIESSINSIEKILKENEYIYIYGCLKEVYFNKNLYKYLKQKSKNFKELKDNLFNVIRRVQYIENQYFEPNTYIVEGEDSWTYISVTFGIDYFLPKVDNLVIFFSESEDYLVEYDKLYEIKFEKLRLIDGAQFVLDALREEELRELLRKLRRNNF